MATYRLIGYGFDDKRNSGEIRAIGAFTMIRAKTAGKPVRHRHSFWTLSCRAGASELFRPEKQRGEWMKLPLHAVSLTPPDFSYWQDFSALKEPMQASYIAFLGGEAAGLEQMTNGNSRSARFLDSDGSMAAAIKQAAIAADEGKEKAYLKVQAAIFSVLARMAEQTEYDKEKGLWKKPDSRSNGSSDALKKRLTDFFSARLQGKVSVEMAAAEFGLSVPGIYKKCKAAGIESPMRILASLRIEKAKTYILQGDSLKTTAYKCGFYDAYHLSRVFKQQIGVSPRRFLKSIPIR